MPMASDKEPEEEEDALSSAGRQDATGSRGKGKASTDPSAQHATSVSNAPSAVTHPDLREVFNEVRISIFFLFTNLQTDRQIEDRNK